MKLSSLVCSRAGRPVRTRIFSALLIVTLLAQATVSRGMLFHYGVTLSGPNESPANASPAVGAGSADYDSTAHTLQLQVTFSGLTGGVTASHIHAATATAGSGTSGVATTTPTFAGFPNGVTSGSYSNTLDLTLASSYNPAYVTANGGTTATAEAALAAAFAANKSYLNIHTTTFPGGEIRGFLTPLSTVFMDFTTSLAVADPTQLGRVSRSGFPSDWTTPNKVFPGTINTNVSYRYHTYTLTSASIGSVTNLQIAITDSNTPPAVFLTFYKDAFTPDTVATNRGLDTNYLGDVGASGNVAAGLLMPSGRDLILVAGDVASPVANTGKVYRIEVEGFVTPPVPRIVSSSISGTNLMLNVTNVLKSRIYNLLANSNVTLVRTQWATVRSIFASTNVGANRSMGFTNGVVSNTVPLQFYRLQYK